jgi:hypothetical protein
MRIPEDAVISEDKLKRYLLVKRPLDDKSGFLGRAGFTARNWIELRRAIRRLADSYEAEEDRTSEYGTFYRVDGQLVGETATLSVTLIWMRRAVDNGFHFITLKPRKG